MINIPACPADRPASSDDFHAPLLSDDNLAAMERFSLTARWPQKQLLTLVLRLSRAERAVHVAQVAGDPDAVTAAEWQRTSVRADLRAEKEHVADVFLSSLSHAIEHKPAEVADLMAAVFASPTVRAALVPVLQTILAPTVTWLKGEHRDLGDRVQDVEHAVNEMGVMA